MAFYVIFLYWTMAHILLLMVLNFIWNIFLGNDCGFYSVRGFTAFLVCVCTIASIIIDFLLQVTIEVFNMIFGFKSREVLHQESEQNKLKEDSFDDEYNFGKLRDDFYSITFLGYVYTNPDQREDIIIDDELNITEEELYNDPSTERPRVLTD